MCLRCDTFSSYCFAIRYRIQICSPSKPFVLISNSISVTSWRCWTYFSFRSISIVNSSSNDKYSILHILWGYYDMQDQSPILTYAQCKHGRNWILNQLFVKLPIFNIYLSFVFSVIWSYSCFDLCVRDYYDTACVAVTATINARPLYRYISTLFLLSFGNLLKTFLFPAGLMTNNCGIFGSRFSFAFSFA